MSKWKVVVTDYEFGELRFEEAVFEGLDIELVKGQARTEEEVIELCRDADGIINQYAPLSERVIKELNNCKVISRYGVGVNTIHIPSSTEKGICVTNVPDYSMDEVSDHALALIMSIARKVVTLNEYVKKGVWDYKKGIPIRRARAQVVSVLGFGRIPRRLVAKLIAIGYQVNVYDPYVPEEAVREAGANPVSLEEAVRTGDFISVHVPLMDNTKGLIGEKEFAMMKPTAVIINTARGPVIDEQALIKALQTNQIAGAGLDVVEIEPIPKDHPFLTMENVVINPHAAWYSTEAAEEMRTKAARNIVEVLNGFYPTYLVNHDVKSKVILKEK